MNGVTILREITPSAGGALTFFILAMTCLVIIVVILYLQWKEYIAESSNILYTFSTLMAIFLLMSAITLTEKDDRIKYDILIDDSVTANEFFEHYELEKIDGKIYTVKEIGSID